MFKKIYDNIVLTKIGDIQPMAQFDDDFEDDDFEEKEDEQDDDEEDY